MAAHYTSAATLGPFQNYAYDSSFSTYGSPEQTGQGGLKRHDSVLENSRATIRPVRPRTHSDKTSHAGTRGFTRDTSAGRTQAASAGHQVPDPNRPSQGPVPGQAAFRFCVTTTNPQVKDKAEMRENRKHVMHDFLRKEGRKTSGLRDARAAGQARPDKRRRCEPPTAEAPTSLNPAAPSHLFGPGVLTPQSSCDGTASLRHWDSENEESGISVAAVPEASIPRVVVSDLSLGSGHQLDSDEEENHEKISEAEAASSDTGGPHSLLGFRVGPYHSFFQATQPNVDLEKMKYDCGRRLRCPGMVATWLPVLARSKHCFLSTICISAAHEEAMRAVAFGTEDVHRSEVYEILAVKSQVQTMINAILDDPSRRTSDETMIAVMNLLNSEMIGCDLKAIHTHQNGLHTMVLMRGGLSALGVHEHLARTLTITMLVNSILREKVADDMYLHYAQRQAAPSTTNGKTSMFYCGVLEWSDLSRFLSQGSQLMALLEVVRKLTGTFRGNANSKARLLRDLRDQIWRFEERASTAVPTQGDRMYEAVRLTSRVYADALANGVPFSRACRAEYLAKDNKSKTRPVAFVEIAQSLIQTNLQDFWGGLSGVLFWVALVAGAAATGSQVEELDELTNLASKRQEHAASRLLAAIAVRGSIVFGFEQGSAVLGTLSNMLDLQDRLGGRYGRLEKRRTTFGPERLLGRQSGFGDFAREFLSSER